MAKCLNCAEAALYLVKNLGTSDQTYCLQHLPKFVQLAKHLGDIVFEINSEIKEVKKSNTTPPKKKKDAVDEAPVETPVVEAPVEQA